MNTVKGKPMSATKTFMMEQAEAQCRLDSLLAFQDRFNELTEVECEALDSIKAKGEFTEKDADFLASLIEQYDSEIYGLDWGNDYEVFAWAEATDRLTSPSV